MPDDPAADGKLLAAMDALPAQWAMIASAHGLTLPQLLRRRAAALHARAALAATPLHHPSWDAQKKSAPLRRAQRLVITYQLCVIHALQEHLPLDVLRIILAFVRPATGFGTFKITAGTAAGHGADSDGLEEPAAFEICVKRPRKDAKEASSIEATLPSTSRRVREILYGPQAVSDSQPPRVSRRRKRAGARKRGQTALTRALAYSSSSDGGDGGGAPGAGKRQRMTAK